MTNPTRKERGINFKNFSFQGRGQEDNGVEAVVNNIQNLHTYWTDSGVPVNIQDLSGRPPLSTIKKKKGKKILG
jgi:hypothetical protein